MRNINDLTLEQKIGQLICVRWYNTKEDKDFLFEMLKKGAVGAVFVQGSFPAASPVENAQGDPLLPQAAEHMVHPVYRACRFSADMRPDHTGSIVAQPEQLHFLTPFLLA